MLFKLFRLSRAGAVVALVIFALVFAAVQPFWGINAEEPFSFQWWAGVFVATAMMAAAGAVLYFQIFQYHYVAACARAARYIRELGQEAQKLQSGAFLDPATENVVFTFRRKHFLGAEHQVGVMSRDSYRGLVGHANSERQVRIDLYGNSRGSAIVTHYVPGVIAVYAHGRVMFGGSAAPGLATSERIEAALRGQTTLSLEELNELIALLRRLKPKN